MAIGSVVLTDNPPQQKANRYNYYSSYLDESDLIFDWKTGRDTFLDIEIKKSKENISDNCHSTDPNVLVDKQQFVFHGKLIRRGETAYISK